VAIADTTNPPCAPRAPTAQPAIAVPAAEPAAVAEFDQTKACVSALRGMMASVSTEQTTMFRGTASPVSTMP
jgi:hypothetical protein